MFKLVVLSALFACAFAGIIHHEPAVAIGHVTKTYVEPHHTVVETPTISHVGSVVKSIPTGVSHHESSVVHSHAHSVEVSTRSLHFKIFLLTLFLLTAHPCSWSRKTRHPQTSRENCC